MAYYLQLAIDIQRRPTVHWDRMIAALPPDARAPVQAWLAANPTSSGYKSCDWAPPRHRSMGSKAPSTDCPRAVAASR